MTSRLRQPRARCRLPRNPAVPRRAVGCGTDDALAWFDGQSVASAQPLAGLLASPRGWDLDAPEREHIAAELAAWPFPGTWGARPLPSIRYVGRANTEPPPMRQRGVMGDLRAGVGEIKDRKSKVRAA